MLFIDFTFASRKNKHLREPEAMSNELFIVGWIRPRSPNLRDCLPSSVAEYQEA